MFYIVDQNARISTPVDRLLQQRDIAASAAARTDAAAARAERAPGQRAAATYEREQRPPARREPVIRAGQLMASPVQTVPHTAGVGETARLFAKVGYHHLPVVDTRQELVGIVSERDLLRAAAAQLAPDRIDNWPLTKLMTAPVICATADTEIRVLAEVMAARHISALPIVDGSQRVVGMVTRSDILRALVHSAPLELWT